MPAATHLALEYVSVNVDAFCPVTTASADATGASVVVVIDVSCATTESALTDGVVLTTTCTAMLPAACSERAVVTTSMRRAATSAAAATCTASTDTFTCDATVCRMAPRTVALRSADCVAPAGDSRACLLYTSDAADE